MSDTASPDKQQIFLPHQKHHSHQSEEERGGKKSHPDYGLIRPYLYAEVSHHRHPGPGHPSSLFATSSVHTIRKNLSHNLFIFFYFLAGAKEGLTSDNASFYLYPTLALPHTKQRTVARSQMSAGGNLASVFRSNRSNQVRSHFAALLEGISWWVIPPFFFFGLLFLSYPGRSIDTELLIPCFPGSSFYISKDSGSCWQPRRFPSCPHPTPVDL